MCVRHSVGRFNSGLISDGSGDRGRRAGIFGEVHCDVRCLLFWDLARRGIVVAYRRFAITSVPSSRMRQWNKVHDSSRCCPETLLTGYQATPRIFSVDRKQLQLGGNLKFRMFWPWFLIGPRIGLLWQPLKFVLNGILGNLAVTVGLVCC